MKQSQSHSPIDLRQTGQGSARGTRLPHVLRHFFALARGELAVRFSPVEWILLAILIGLPAALAWRFASPSFFISVDIVDFVDVHTERVGWLDASDPAGGHLVPATRLSYVVLYLLAPMNWDAALAFLVVCHAVSAVLLQRVLTLLFGRAWWTYALALAWAISVVYLPGFAYFAAGLGPFAAIAATLASIHAYLCWRTTGRGVWLAWSLVAMCVGLAFYEKALLIPIYLFLMRVLLLDAAVRLRDSLRSVRDEWRVWLAYATVSAGFILVYSLGPYQSAETTEVSDLLRYLRVFWFEGFWPMVFGVRVPQFGQDDWHSLAIVGAQAALIGLAVWSIARRRIAWRAWVFLFVAVMANALMLIQRVSVWGPDLIGHEVRYYTEPALLVPLAIAFAFAPLRLCGRATAVEPATPIAAEPSAAEGANFRLPRAAAGTAALVTLVAYVSVTLATTDSFSKPWLARPGSDRIPSGRLARGYFDNLRADLAGVRRAGLEPSLLDHEVPEWVVPQIENLGPWAGREGVRYTLASSIVPLFDDNVTFNQPGPLYIVRPDGHLRRTRFVPSAGGRLAELRRSGILRVHLARLESGPAEWCVVAEGLGSALEWSPSPHLYGSDWWLRVSYRTDPVEPFLLVNNDGVGWVDEGPKLPPRRNIGTAIIPLSEQPTGQPTNAGVRLIVPPFGRLCLGSLEIGSFDPPASVPSVGGGIDTQVSAN